MSKNGSDQGRTAMVVLAPLGDDPAGATPAPRFQIRLPRSARRPPAVGLDQRPWGDLAGPCSDEAAEAAISATEPADDPLRAASDGGGEAEPTELQRPAKDPSAQSARLAPGSDIGEAPTSSDGRPQRDDRVLSSSLFIPAETSRGTATADSGGLASSRWRPSRPGGGPTEKTAGQPAERPGRCRLCRQAASIAEGALRSYRRFKVQPHRATSDQLGGIYPFLAEAGLGSNGVYVGSDSYSGSAFVFDPFVLYQRGAITNPNMLVAGVLGSGKSAFARSFTTRSIPFARRVYVPGDPKGEWSVVARAVGGQAIELGRGLRTLLNPLDEGIRPNTWVAADGPREPKSDELWAAVVRGRRQDLLKAITQSALGHDLASVEVTAVFAALDAAVAATEVPTLPHVVAALHDPPWRCRAQPTNSYARTGGRPPTP